MNKNGQVIFFTLMIGVVVLILTMSFAFPVKQGIEDATNSTGDSTSTINLDCANESISNFNKATCRIADISLFYFIGGLLFMVGGILAARVLL